MVLERRHIWITGGGGAIGSQVALLYAKKGWIVTISGRDIENLKKVAEHSPLIQIEPCDITQTGDVEDLILRLEKVDIALLNAGTYAPNPTSKTDLTSIRDVMDVNYFGTINCILPLLEKMENTGGRIAVVGSLAGYIGLPNAAGYGASKSAIINLCESLRSELQGSGIQIQLINPGFVKSKLTQKNDFEMPELINASEAASEIYKGLQSDKFEITFPRKFARKMKILQLLPYSFYFKLIRKIVKS